MTISDNLQLANSTPSTRQQLASTSSRHDANTSDRARRVGVLRGDGMPVAEIAVLFHVDRANLNRRLIAAGYDGELREPNAHRQTIALPMAVADGEPTALERFVAYIGGPRATIDIAIYIFVSQEVCTLRVQV